MKTLDEVISMMEYEATYNGGEARDYDADALHYLKTIETTENLYHDAVNALSKWEDEDWKDRCLPLTWDELKQMEGKPVWVEADEEERWRIIREVTNEHLILESGLPLHKSWMNHPDGWQAYRKENNGR